MSSGVNIIKTENENVQYIYEDDQLLDDINQQELSEILYANGTRAILVQNIDGQFYIPTNGQLIIKNEDNIFVESNSSEQDEMNIVQFVDKPVSHVVHQEGMEDQEVVYYTEGLYENSVSDADGVQFVYSDDTEENIVSLEENDVEPQLKHFKLTDTQENMIIADEIYTENSESEPYQYAVIKNGKLHIQTGDRGSLELLRTLAQQEVIEDDENSVLEENDDSNLTMDDDTDIISKITGRNLITGQTVTLDKYLHRLQRKMHIDDPKSSKTNQQENESENLDPIINKKLVLGRTSNGKKLVGKILKITKGNNYCEKEQSVTEKTATDCCNQSQVVHETEAEEVVEINQDEVIEFDNPAIEKENHSQLENEVTIDEKSQAEQEPKVLIKTHVISRQSFEYISKTLAGLMEMDSIQKKLLHKNVLVKLITKTYDSKTNSYKKSVSYLFGYMKTVLERDSDEVKWIFALAEDDPEDEASERERSPYEETTSLTLIITIDKYGKKMTRINLNPKNTAHKCKECEKSFKSSLHLKRHENGVHGRKTSSEGKSARWYACEVCKKEFNTHSSLKRHLSVHNPNLRPLECTLCLQRFTDRSTLKRHLLIHSGIKAFRCVSCPKSFKHLGDLNTHQRTHDHIKQYICDVCGREFTRHCNLQRHVEIHKGEGALYRCEICGCSYNFVSSLTRHVVQNHISQS